jgi:hypothetical protein
VKNIGGMRMPDEPESTGTFRTETIYNFLLSEQRDPSYCTPHQHPIRNNRNLVIDFQACVNYGEACSIRIPGFDKCTWGLLGIVQTL